MPDEEFQDASDDHSGHEATQMDSTANTNTASTGTQDNSGSVSPKKKKNKKKNKKKAAGSTDEISIATSNDAESVAVEGGEKETEEEEKEAEDTETAQAAETINTDATETEYSTKEDVPLGESTQQFELSEADLKESNKSLEEKLDMLKMYEDDDDEEGENNKTPAEDAAKPPPPALPSRDAVPVPAVPAVPVLPPRDAPTVPSLPPRDTAALPALPPRAPATESPDTPVSPGSERNISKQMELSQTAAALPPPPLPPQLSERQKQNHRGSIFQSWFSGSSRGSKSESVDEKEVTYDENYDMLLSRLNENTVDFSTKDDVSKEQINSTHDTLKSSFATAMSHMDSDESELKIDWTFWSEVVNDYASVAKSDPSRLSKELSNGIPPPIRGIVWQLVANANPKEFEASYEELHTKESQYEKSITKDLSRTSFVDDTGVDKDSLYRVIKAYSNADTEVGYTQGMAFIAVPLLMNMSELEAFTMLHKLMYHYNLRSHFLPDMPGLLVKMYQFDRLLEDQLPSLSTHLQRQGVRSSMYASQWFLTFFAYKFPLEIVLRIYDIVITEGVESILKFAVALMQKNVDTLLTLNFDELLDFLKNQLFFAYLKTPLKETKDEEEETETGTAIDSSKVSIGAESYLVDQLVEDATEVKILPMTLHRYADEFEEIHREEKERREEIDELKFRNNQMKREIRKVEASYTILNREHVQIANEMINARMKYAELEDENNDLKRQNNVLRERVKALQNPITEDTPLPASLEEDLKNTMERNLEVMNKNQELEDQMQSLLQEVEELKAQLEAEKSKNEETSLPPPSSPVKSHATGLWGKKLFK